MKRLTNKTIGYLTMLMVASMYFLFLFVLPYAFNIETDSNYHYLVVAITTTVLFFAAFFYRPASLLHVVTAIVLIAISLWYLYRSCYDGGNEYLGFCYTFVLVTWLFLTLEAKALYIFPGIFTAFFLYEIILAGRQWLTAIDGSHEITGTFRNSGIFAIYLVVNIPFLQFVLFRGSVLQSICTKLLQHGIESRYLTFWRNICWWVERIIFFVVLAFCLALVFFVGSRTAMIAFFSIVLVLLIGEYGAICRKKLSAMSVFMKTVGVSLLLFAGGGIAWYLFELKKMSAYGRLLMIDIAWRHKTDGFLLGTGIGRFTWYYPQWQANYFKNTVNPPLHFFLSAGESYLVFNEFIQLFETVGITGSFLFVLLLYWFFKSTAAEPHTALLRSVKATMLGILGCGFTSYPFHVNGILLLISFCFATAAIVRDKKAGISSLQQLFAGRAIQAALSMLLILTAGFTAFRSARQYQAVREWQYIRERSSADREGVKEKYKELYRSLKTDGKFLTEYGEYLCLAPDDCRLAVNMLEDAKSHFISRKTVTLTGYAYKQLKNYPKAIENFEWVANYLPNNFSSRLELLKLYKLSGDPVKAVLMGTQILTMPVKIPSEEVDRIKRETREILKEFNKS